MELSACGEIKPWKYFRFGVMYFRLGGGDCISNISKPGNLLWIRMTIAMIISGRFSPLLLVVDWLVVLTAPLHNSLLISIFPSIFSFENQQFRSGDPPPSLFLSLLPRPSPHLKIPLALEGSKQRNQPNSVPFSPSLSFPLSFLLGHSLKFLSGMFLFLNFLAGGRREGQGQGEVCLRFSGSHVLSPCIFWEIPGILGADWSSYWRNGRIFGIPKHCEGFLEAYLIPFKYVEVDFWDD